MSTSQNDKMLTECLRIQRPGEEEEHGDTSWQDKPLHSMYHQSIEEVADFRKSYQWLEKAGLKGSTEALIIA